MHHARSAVPVVPWSVERKMVGRLAAALTLSAVLSSAAAAQQSITASAVILERAEADPIEVELRSVGSRISVEQSVRQHAGTRLLRSTYVNTGSATDGVEETVPMRVREDGILRLERRGIRSADGEQVELRSGEHVLIDRVRELTITRIVAANS